jgi:hypothetical protein
MVTTSAPPTATYRSVFAVREFRILFTGLLVYLFGFEFEILGLSVLVYAQTHSSFLAALAFSMGFAPQVLGGALFTSLADRLPPRTVITVGLLLRAMPGLLIGSLPGMPVPVMLVLVAAAAAITPVYSAATSGLLADVLPGDQYVLGRSAMSLLSSGGQILSLGVAGAILAVLPARRLLLAAGLALVLSALIRRRVVRPRPAPAPAAPAAPAAAPPAPAVPTGGVVRATLAGNARLLRNRRVRDLLLAQWLPLAFVSGAESLVVPYVGSTGHPASAAGPLLAAAPAGMVISNWLVGRFCRPATRERLVLPLALLSSLPWLLFAIRPPLLAAGAAMFASGVGDSYLLGLQQPFLDSVPAELRRRAFGLNVTGVMSGQGLLPWVTGACAAIFGPAATIAVTGGAGIVSALALYRPLSGCRVSRSPDSVVR